MADIKQSKSKRQKQAAVRIVIMIAILICANVLASYFHTNIDLTKENRFTLSAPTKKLLRNLKEVAVIDVYLKGKFPAGLQRLQEAVRERLTSFKEIAGNKIIFRFIDPLEGKSDEEQKQIVHDLDEKGIRVVGLNTQTDDEFSTKYFFPYALVQYNGNQMPVYLLENPPGSSQEEKINYSEGKLEYKLASALNELGKPDAAHIAYLLGNGEELSLNTVDMISSMTRRYHTDTLNLAHTVKIPLVYDVIVVNNPTEPFTGPEKLRIDQFIMRGGHMLLIMNSLNASMDSLAHSPEFIAMPKNLDLDDLLFMYGIRVNNDLIEDQQCMKMPREGNGMVEMHDWVYFPKFNPTSTHPIVRNMDFIMGGFANSIDTMKNALVKKTILLQSSKYSRVAPAPARVSFGIMNFPMRNELFNKPYRPAAVLLEGKFHSAYDKRLAPEYLRILDSLKQPFKNECDTDNSMIIVSVGDIFRNEYSAKDGPTMMGYYSRTGDFFANRDFMLNCLEFLTDHSGILEARSKEVKLRLLDAGRAKDEKTMWQIVNVGIPVAAVLIFASCYLFFRKRRYETKTNNNPS